MKLSKYIPIIMLFCFLLFIVLIVQNVYAYGSPNKYCFTYPNDCGATPSECNPKTLCSDKLYPAYNAKCETDVEAGKCPYPCAWVIPTKCVYELIPVTLNLSANPSSGTSPLLNVKLTANLSSTLKDVTVLYRFDCGDGVWSTQGGSNTYTCNYANSGNFTARAEARYSTSFDGWQMRSSQTIIKVDLPAFNFNITTNPTSGSVTRSNSVTTTVTVARTAGTGATVNLAASSLPTGVTASFSPTSCNPGTGSCTSTLTLSANSTAPAITSDAITITGTSGSISDSATYYLTVVVPNVSCTITANPSSGTAPLNDVDVKATVGGTATGDIVYQFDCNNDGTYEYISSATSYNPYTRSDLCDYANSGTYTVKVRVTRQGVSATCTNTVTVKSPPVVDIKARQSGSGTYSNGPITIGYNSKADLQWTATNATSCIASGDWSGSKASSGTNTETTGNLFTDKSYTITCSNGAGGTDSDSVIVNVSDPTLFVAFSADKTSGSSPLTGVTFTATVSGSAIGTINYTFYCNRNDSGTNITTPYSYKIDGTNINPLTLANTCDSVYTAPGTYYAKMIVERDSATPVEARITIVVTNNPPTATNLKVVPSNACLVAPYYACSWTYTDPDNDDESQFLFQVDDNSDFSSPVIDRTIDIDFPSPSSNNQPAILSTIPSPDHILFNTRYYWRVKVVDAYGMSSAWVNGASFITPLHHSPIVRFTNKPLRPIVHELTWFTDDSRCFDDSPTGGDCAITSGDSFNWTFVNGNPATSTKEIEITEFTVPGTSSSAKLQVTDSDGFTCSLTKSIKVNFPPPIWKEVRPTD